MNNKFNISIKLHEVNETIMETRSSYTFAFSLSVTVCLDVLAIGELEKVVFILTCKILSNCHCEVCRFCEKLFVDRFTLKLVFWVLEIQYDGLNILLNLI